MSKVVAFKGSKLPAGLYRAKKNLYARCYGMYRYVAKGKVVSLDEGEANHNWEQISIPLKASGRSATIVNAIAQLDPENNSHWTEKGLIRIEALRGLAGDESITREEVENANPGLCRDIVEHSNIPKKKENNTHGQGRRILK